MHRGHSRRRVSVRRRLVLNRRERIVRHVVALHREQVLHGGDGDIDLLIVAIVVAPADGAHAANHRETHVIDRDGLAQHGPARKQQLGALVSQHHHAPMLRQVRGIDETAFRQRHKPDLRKIRLYTQHLARSVCIGTHFIKIVAVQKASNRTNLRQLANGSHIPRRELVGTHPRVLVGDSGDGPVEHQNHVISEGSQLPALPGTKPLAEPYQHQQRAHSPGDAKHGQKRAQLVGGNRAKHLPESVGETLHICSTRRSGFGPLRRISVDVFK